MKKPSRACCAVIGSVSLCLGIAGLFLDILPAAFFFLLALAAYMHCSTRFIRWFMKNKALNGYFIDFMVERSMTRYNKIRTLLLTTTLALLAFIFSEPLWAKIIIGVLVVVKYYYIVFCVWTKIADGHGCRGGVRHATQS